MKAQVILGGLISVGVLGFSMTSYAAPLGQSWKTVHWGTFTATIPTFWTGATIQNSAVWGPGGESGTAWEMDWVRGVSAFAMAHYLEPNLPLGASSETLRESSTGNVFEMIWNSSIGDGRQILMDLPKGQGALVFTWTGFTSATLPIFQMELRHWSITGIKNPFTATPLLPKVTTFRQTIPYHALPISWKTVQDRSVTLTIPTNWTNRHQNPGEWATNSYALDPAWGYVTVRLRNPSKAMQSLMLWGNWKTSTSSQLYAWNHSMGYVAVVPSVPAIGGQAVVTEVVPTSQMQDYVIQVTVPGFELNVATRILQSWHLGNLNLYHQNGHLVLPTLVSPSIAQQLAKQYGA